MEKEPYNNSNNAEKRMHPRGAYVTKVVWLKKIETGFLAGVKFEIDWAKQYAKPENM